MSLLHLLRKPDFITGLVVAAVGTVYVVNTFFIQTTAAVVDPSTLPRIVGVGLMVLGMLLALSAARPKHRVTGHAKTTPTSATAETGVETTAPVESGTVDAAATAVEVGQTEATTTRPSVRLVVLFFAMFFGYLYILIPVGFLVSTFTLLLTITTIYDSSKWLRNSIFAAAFAISVYFTFTYGLGVFLPPGILG